MKGYELLYIVGTQFTDQEIAGIQSKIEEMLTQAEAKVLKTQNIGKIKLAYPIQKIRHGTYVLCYFDAEPSVIADLNRRLGLTQEVVRHTLLARSSGALERTFELTSYVAPLSEEAKSEKRVKREPTKIFRKVIPRIPPPTPVRAQEPPMTMEELDRKLDKILEGDIAENI